VQGEVVAVSLLHQFFQVEGHRSPEFQVKSITGHHSEFLSNGASDDGRHPTVDADADARDVAGAWREQERGQVGELLSATDSAQRDLRVRRHGRVEVLNATFASAARRTHCPDSMRPMRIAFARMPLGPTSLASDLVSARPARRDADVGVVLAFGVRANVASTFTIAPCVVSKAGRTCRPRARPQ